MTTLGGSPEDGLAGCLCFAPRSPFAKKILVALVEIGLDDRVKLQPTDPWTDETLRRVNPLCKVPTLVLSNGVALFDSRVIVDYLDAWSGAKLVPGGERRWEALKRQALGDGLSESVIRRFVEQLGPEHDRTGKVVARQEAAITSVLDELERDPSWMSARVDIGHVAVAVALEYLSARSPEIAWMEARPLLAGWFYGFRARPSMKAAAAPELLTLRASD